MTTPTTPRLHDYLTHILQGILRIQSYTDLMDEAEFLTDERTQDAVIRNFEVIGEAAKNIEQRYPEYAERNSVVPWRSVYEMRNALAHGYFKIDVKIVWRTIAIDLPEIEFQIQKLIDDENDI
ncbi:MAG: DUF86 domain-containing protein [Gammaproteobacteria bacterium]|nr:DUF86 domain-containing protein [Gammaproteobacteria bacterium]